MKREFGCLQVGWGIGKGKVGIKQDREVGIENTQKEGTMVTLYIACFVQKLAKFYLQYVRMLRIKYTDS
jgi:hypothetical protein